MSVADHKDKMAEAEALIGERLSRVAFAKGLYFGRYLAGKLPPYPPRTPDPATAEMLGSLAEFCRREIDPAAIDRAGRIPEHVIRGLGQLGVLGACLPKSCGGRGSARPPIAS